MHICCIDAWRKLAVSYVMLAVYVLKDQNKGDGGEALNSSFYKIRSVAATEEFHNEIHTEKRLT